MISKPWVFVITLAECHGADLRSGEETCYCTKGAKGSWLPLAGYILGAGEVTCSCWSRAEPAPVKGRFGAVTTLYKPLSY